MPRFNEGESVAIFSGAHLNKGTVVGVEHDEEFGTTLYAVKDSSGITWAVRNGEIHPVSQLAELAEVHPW